MPPIGRYLQRYQGLVDGDGTKDSSIYFDQHGIVIDALGRSTGSPAFRVRGINPSTNAPTTVFQVNKDGTVTWTGQPINVVSYGAVGDGVADDTNAVINAVAAGSVVYFPAGTYKLTSYVPVAGNKVLLGAGQGATIVKQSVQYADGSAAPLNGTTDRDAFRVTGSNVVIQDMTVRGAATSSPTPIADNAALKGVGAKGISVQNDTTPIANVVIQRVTVEQVQSNGIQVWEGVTDVALRDVTVQDVGNEGVYVSGTTTVGGVRTGHVAASGMTIRRCGGWGFDTTAGRISLTEFLVEGNGTQATYFSNDSGGVVIAPTADAVGVTIANGRIVDNKGDSQLFLAPSAYLDFVTLQALAITVSDRAVYATTGVKLQASLTGAQGTRFSTFAGVRCVECDIQVLHGYYLTLTDCQAIRTSTPSAENADSASSQGIRVDTNGPTLSGRIALKGCLVTGWGRGIWWQTCAGATSVGNVADGCGHAGYSSGTRIGIGWNSGGTVTLYLASHGDAVYNQIGGTAFSQGSGIAAPSVMGAHGATVPPAAAFQSTVDVAGVLTAAASAYVGDTSNAKATGPALTVNQAGSDDEVLAVKSSDVTHAFTTPTEADTYGVLKKTVPASGGLDVVGYTSATAAIEVVGRYTTGDTTKSSAGSAGVILQASKLTGNTAGAPGANENLLAVLAHGTTKAIIDAEGDQYLGGGLFLGTDAKAIQTACELFAGTGAPNNANGQNGDVYFRSDGGAGTTIYQKRAGSWTGIV